MSGPSFRRHDSEGPVAPTSSIPEPSYAERARTLVHRGRVGSLSTLSRKRPGWPFGSVMPYAGDEQGRPIFLISTMAVHTQNLLQDPRASLLITQPDGEGDPLGMARVTLMGRVSRVPEEELAGVRERYLAGYENARYWVDFDDFAFYRMDIVDVYFVGGFGMMGWITAEEYYRVEPDPLADIATGILQHMNTDHADSLILLAKVFGNVEAEEAVMTSVDRLGFQVRLKTGERVYGTRIPFLREVRTPQEARTVLVEMVRQARETIRR
ncbi:MAG TPA: DUF2470 domain-containing protein [Candidatus Limnocylindrales bacterium]|nr:DUF2470 domain-containing protein [Candidatus Limnocylindrales bacterium]